MLLKKIICNFSSRTIIFHDLLAFLRLYTMLRKMYAFAHYNYPLHIDQITMSRPSVSLVEEINASVSCLPNIPDFLDMTARTGNHLYRNPGTTASSSFLQRLVLLQYYCLLERWHERCVDIRLLISGMSIQL